MKIKIRHYNSNEDDYDFYESTGFMVLPGNSKNELLIYFQDQLRPVKVDLIHDEFIVYD